MQFLRTLIWVLIAGIVVAFSFNNWAPVPVKLWGGMVADINLPLLMATMFVLGFAPPYFLHLGTRWRLKSRLAQTERTLNDLRSHALAADPALNHDGPMIAATPAATDIEEVRA